MWCLATTAYYGRKRDCVVANFQFQRNFDMTRYPDFVYHKISADPNSYRSGISYIIRLNRETISSRASFRDPKTGQCTSGLFACKNVERGSPAINFTRIDVDVCPEARQLRDEDRRRRGLGCKLQF
ncbi:hypothetical protein KUTeg_012146 [Tegillarca granosa]|uniref:Uncharacterized protein n=1 Tax=Tegillarca granosa TaxID=220873 RepID=A0ABQ9EYP4_TEGGR|nr:hypothetical protein KUTeg_012146 [Tegillarca granosa]